MNEITCMISITSNHPPRVGYTKRAELETDFRSINQGSTVSGVGLRWRGCENGINMTSLRKRPISWPSDNLWTRARWQRRIFLLWNDVCPLCEHRVHTKPERLPHAASRLDLVTRVLGPSLWTAQKKKREKNSNNNRHSLPSPPQVHVQKGESLAEFQTQVNPGTLA
ncbi:uncharacterized protein BDW70DRAFT_142897 [Aspergillus foveolatus]|uniref:uncharacterized protein n=1 Tax=Aspergillus foveolatus TaxID=210207 RepID=UPI003CCCA194